jgi:aminoglycoside phosphotransferase (APT) family kinase protein
MSGAEVGASAPEIARSVRARLAQRAGRYFAAGAARAGAAHGREPLDASRIRLSRIRERRFSTLFDFEIAGRPVLVKAGAGRRHRRLATTGSPGALPDALRLVPRTPHGQKAAREFRALAAIERHFALHPDPRFASVRALDYFPDFSALCMERLDCENLEFALRRAARSPSATARAGAERALGHAGSWLRVFHAMEPLEHTTPLHLFHEELVACFDSLLDYLVARGESVAFVRELGREIHAALKRLPDPLPAGLAHGDFAPRNLLLDEAGRLIALDTQAGNLAPIHSDLAHFLVALATPPLQPLWRSPVHAAQRHGHWRDAFLAGYFGGAALPRNALALFEIREWLARWAALDHHARAARGWRRALKYARYRRNARGIAERIEALRSELET